MDKYKDNTMSELSILKQREAQKRWRENPGPTYDPLETTLGSPGTTKTNQPGY